MKPLLFVLGTRPEGIKLLPLVWECQKRKIPYEILHTDQHTELLDEILAKHRISPDYRLFLFGRHRDLCSLKAEMLSQMHQLLSERKFSAVLVQGDTLSALVGAEYGFLCEIPVVHIEAGMRTYRQDNPYPEEAFRRMIGAMASLHFCPSEDEARHLRDEGVPEEPILTVGNTFPDYWNTLPKIAVTPKRQILITIHRRENLPFLEQIFSGIAEIAASLPEVQLLFPMHPNPAIVAQAEQRLGRIPNLTLCPPMPPEEFYRELLSSEMVLTDSGGVQEECIFHAKKVLVVRKVSERKTDFDFCRIIDPEDLTIPQTCRALFEQSSTATHCDYYGSGGAAEKILAVLQEQYK